VHEAAVLLKKRKDLFMAKTCLPQLEDALRARRMIRFRQRYDDYLIRGYVLDIGPVFFLIAVVSDRVWFDGFECFRIQDVRRVVAEPYAKFAETALRKRRERRPKKPRVSVASVGELLLTAGRAFPLVTLHREAINSRVCSIGRILGVEDGNVSLLEINPDATWEKTPITYRLKDITHVNLGGDYANALHLVSKG
jgi:hypothetical protein